MRIVMHDFTRLIEAKQMAMSLMDQGIQFTFSPQPISISHPMALGEGSAEKHIDETKD